MITFRRAGDLITGTINGKPFSMAKNDANYKYIVKAQKENTPESEIREYVKNSRNFEVADSNKFLVFKPATNEYFLSFDGYRSKQAIPPFLRERIETAFDKGDDIMPFVKGWARLLDNVRYNPVLATHFDTYISAKYIDKVEAKRLVDEEDYTKEAAEALCTYDDLAFTQEGMLVTYKVARQVTWEYTMELQEDGHYKKVKKDLHKRIPAKLDPTTGDVLEPETFEKPASKEEFVFTPAIYTNGDKFFSGDALGYIYQVGKVQYLPEDALRNLSHTFGGGGLYTGGLSYVEGYRNSGTHVLVCFIDPADILSFQCEGAAMRVDAIMPNNIWDEDVILKGTYHSSDYKKMSEDRIAEIIKKLEAANE